jgi:DNA-binding NarL/FixJ family response regulator
MSTILIVDDHPATRSAIRARVVGSHLGFDVCGEAVDGVDAIGKAMKLKPDLVLLDFSMPRMNGVETASVLKGLMPHLRIVMFTMYAESLGRTLASAVGIDAVLSKPDGVGELIQCIRSLLP